MRRFFAFLALLLCAFAAPAADLAAAVKQQLVQAPVLRGEFEQRKQVQGFSKPLVSRGRFVVARERGVLWTTLAPFASELRLTRDEIVATQAGGAVAFRLDAAKEPSVRVINGLMFSLLNGEVNGLMELFKVDGSADAKGWKLVLVPKQAALAKLMSGIELAGDSHVRSIRIDEANGDRTLIAFSAQSVEPPRLSADEAKKFDQ
ncbi:outer membrane lipoprotein carrier protein LolA [Pelomonas sp. KK5]|uniref:outer membrane lipoprotein carrier protein LolA n=1 Tax=Pelomonas sp. KK5 TaxID=1855730 RepID=UPI00097C9F7B|nr:outer membrane lipoprotein carrier protein LolA [Pelomonas sp. KK5]